MQVAPGRRVDGGGVEVAGRSLEAVHAGPEEADHIDLGGRLDRGAGQFGLPAGEHVAAELRPLVEPAGERLGCSQGEQIVAEPLRRVGGIRRRRSGQQQV